MRFEHSVCRGSLMITNIPYTFGLEAVKYLLLKHEEDIHPRFNIPFILESIDFVLKNNT